MRHWQSTGNSNVAIKTGSTYISHSMTDITAIPMAYLGFSTTPSAKKLTPGDCDDERQPEMAVCRQNRKHLYIWNYGRQDDSSNGKLWVFDHAQLAETNPGRLQQQPTTGNCNMYVLLANLAISGSRLLSQSSLWLILCRPRHHRKSLIWRGNLDAICHSARDVIISGFGPYGHFRLPVTVVLTWQHYFIPVYTVLYPSVVGILTVPFVA